MSEGRKCQVALQDDRRLHFLIQPKFLTSDLLDMVASHFTLKEKEFFGLAFVDDSGHLTWLQMDRRVLEHDYPKKTGPLLLHFQVKFFIESIAFLRDNATIEVFYLQAKQNIYKGVVEADSDTVFELAAHVLQEAHSDFVDDSTTRADLRKLPVLPIKTLKEHPSLTYCEDEIIAHYRKLSGLSRGSAIVNYMTIVESLPTYGIHTYEVKDKTGLPWWIGLSLKGIAQYDYSDRKLPRRVFPWKQLENLYFRDKKFSIEVLDPKRVSVSRRTFGPSNVNVFAWFTTTPQLTKSIWSMAVSQHQFYLDRKQSKAHIPAVRSMSDIAANLSQSTPSLQDSAAGSDSLSQCSSSASLQHYQGNMIHRQSDVSQEDIEEIKAAQKEMYQALKARREALEAALKKKTEDLKNICMMEAELTGELPPETPLLPGEPVPQVRRRMGTAFSLSPKIVDRQHRSEDEEYISKLELEYELQKQICHAAQKLVQDTRLNKKARKQRKTQYINAHLKLKNYERKLKEAIEHSRRCRSQSKEELDSTPGTTPTLRKRGPESESKSSLDSGDAFRPIDGTVPSTSSSQCSLPEYAATSPHTRHLSRESSPIRTSGVGYVPSSVYTTRTQYRNQTYPTFSYRSHSLSSQHDSSSSVKSDTGSSHVHVTRTEVRSSRSDVNIYRSDVRSRDDDHNASYEQKIAEVARTYFDSESARREPSSIRDTVSRDHSARDTPTRESSRAPVINPYVTVDSPHDHRYIPDDDRLHGIGRTGSLDKVWRHRKPSDPRLSEDRMYGSLERNFTYCRTNQEYVGQYGITHIEEGEADSQDWYHSPLPHNVTDTTKTPLQQTPSGEHRPRFYIDDQESFREGFTTVTQYPHCREESKPFEMSDFYQYSERLRRQRHDRQRQCDAVSPTMSHVSSTSGELRTPVSPRPGDRSPGEYAYARSPVYDAASSPTPTYRSDDQTYQTTDEFTSNLV